MAGDGVERRLAAILAADVVGYSRLMEADEDATIRMLDTYTATNNKCEPGAHGWQGRALPDVRFRYYNARVRSARLAEGSFAEIGSYVF